MTSDSVVHVIDDDESARDALLFLLDTADIPACGHASANAFLQSAASAPEIGCIVTDVRMPGTTGIELLQHLRAAGSSVPVVVITGHGDVALAVAAMKAGARDFLEKPYSDEAMLAAVRSAVAHAGGPAGDRPPEGAAQTGQASARQRFAGLSPREREVLVGLVSGHSNKLIARDLGISPRTVEVYRASLMTKTKATSLSHLVRLAMSAGMVPLADPTL